MSTASRWDLPTVTGSPVQARRHGRTVGELEDVGRRAYQEAHAKGYEAGLAAARAENQQLLNHAKAQVENLDRMLNDLTRPFQELDHEVQLALSVARQLVRRELRVDPAQVIAIIRETVALLAPTTRDVRVHLHPDDAAVVREKLAAPGTERAWTIVEDPVMTRGGCRVTTDTAHIDARLEARLHGIMVAILGEERANASRGAEELATPERSIP